MFKFPSKFVPKGPIDNLAALVQLMGYFTDLFLKGFLSLKELTLDKIQRVNTRHAEFFKGNIFYFQPFLYTEMTQVVAILYGI